MKLKLVMVLLLLIFLLGCSGKIKVITLNGANNILNVEYDEPVELVIGGVANIIHIGEGTNVTKITISGIENTVYIPKNLTPQILRTGSANTLIYK